jgi:hypothetical protein
MSERAFERATQRHSERVFERATQRHSERASQHHSEPTRVSRTIDTELSTEELWALLADGEAWATWMVDESDVTVAPGGEGRVVDDGVERRVRIDHLDDGQDGDAARVGFTWWPDDRPDLVSAVELVVLPAATGSRLRVTETFAAASTTVAPLAWDVRLMLLVAQALAVYV